MNLKEYLSKIGKKPTPWAQEKGLSPAIISKLINGKTGIKLKTALEIEKATNGEVTPRDLLR